MGWFKIKTKKDKRIEELEEELNRWRSMWSIPTAEAVVVVKPTVMKFCKRFVHENMPDEYRKPYVGREKDELLMQIAKRIEPFIKFDYVEFHGECALYALVAVADCNEFSRMKGEET